MPVTASPPLTSCPRCRSPVRGEFKYCPSCAYRLRPAAQEPPASPAPSARWPLLLLLAGAGGLLAAALALGMVLFADREGLPPPTGRPARPPPLAGLALADLPHLLARVEAGVAYWVQGPEGPEPAAVVRLRMMPVEVTRGLWLEFLEDLASGRASEAPPATLLRLWEPPEDDAFAARDALNYATGWWEATRGHLAAQGVEDPRPPAGLDPPTFPLDPALRVLLAVPPKWTRLTRYEEIAWALPEGTEMLPVTEVSWFDAVAFAEWASARLELRRWPLRLPLQSEWMHAAHGGHAFGGDDGEGWRYPWGNARLVHACNNANAYGLGDSPALRRVDWPYGEEWDGERWQDGRSVHGLYAMAGNAAEWVLAETGRERRGSYWFGTRDEEIDLGDPTALVYGGSFRDGIVDCGVQSNQRHGKWVRLDHLGFRLVQEEGIW